MMASVPAAAAPGPPDTGASINSMPVAAVSAAARRPVASISVVEWSTSTLPCWGRAASRLALRRPMLTRCSTTMASSREAAHRSAAPRRGKSVTHFRMRAPSMEVTTASVKAEKE